MKEVKKYGENGVYVQGQTRARVGEQGIERESGFRVQSAKVLERKGAFAKRILIFILAIQYISSTAMFHTPL